MNYNPSPKAEFLKSEDNCKAHRQMVENESLRHSLEVALFEMQRRAAQYTESTNFNACAASHLRLLGAHDFIDIFLNLAEQPVAAQRTNADNLPGNVTTLKK